MAQLVWSSRSDPGRRRRNEDSFFAADRIFAVADGMGGHDRGDLAAEMAVAALATLPPVFQRTEVLEAVRGAHRSISRLAADTGGAGMGTTLTGIAFEPDDPSSVLVFNVGDSRVYRLRAGALEQLTNDHSVVQELIDAGELSPSEAETHHERHIVTRSLGEGGRLEIEWSQEDLHVGDRFLVCSDGLTREVPDVRIAALLGAAGDVDAAAESLLASALENGARDNVTITVVDVLEIADGAVGGSTTPRSGSVDEPVAVSADRER